MLRMKTVKNIELTQYRNFKPTPSFGPQPIHPNPTLAQSFFEQRLKQNI